MATRRERATDKTSSKKPPVTKSSSQPAPSILHYGTAPFPIEHSPTLLA
jgi:hypothetical protein